MGSKRRCQISKDISDAAKLCHLGSGLLYRHVLGDNYEEYIKYNEHGKPYVENGPRFNVSHSKDFAILYVAENECGIDIEKIDSKKIILSPKIFSENELAWINCEAENNFFYGWTRKESIAKTIGAGFTYPFKDIPIIDENCRIFETEIFTKTFYYKNHVISVSQAYKKPELDLIELNINDF